jgi:hypothetical protein
MAVEYVNRKRDRYYLHERKTKKGNPSYFFSKKEDGVLVESIPDGFEIYENPNAQVFLRKIRPKIFTDEELSIVEKAVKKYSAVEHFVVDVKDNSIVVLLPDQDLDQLKAIFSRFILPGSTKLDEIFEERTSYSPMMRFVLVDKEKREFDVERWCFLGSIDGWIDIDSSNDLAKLAKRYCKHLGRESLYNLSSFNTEGTPL